MYLKECLCKVVVLLINLLLFDVLVTVANEAPSILVPRVFFRKRTLDAGGWGVGGGGWGVVCVVAFLL